MERNRGYEADVVILDLVRASRSSQFLEDPHRLIVALTRARSCEFILMQPGMKHLMKDGVLTETKNLSKLWEHCESRGLLVELGR
jgi:superfamily I DNA and/or RNA helicase